MKRTRDLTTFVTVLRSEGAVSALAYLNTGVPHRFTAVFRIDGNNLRNVLMFDKLGELKSDQLEVIPLRDSFCKLVLRDGAFITENSFLEEQLDASPLQGIWISYTGVPLISREGEVIGTLCHFDLIENMIKGSEFELLCEAGRVLADFLPP